MCVLVRPVPTESEPFEVIVVTSPAVESTIAPLAPPPEMPTLEPDVIRARQNAGAQDDEPPFTSSRVPDPDSRHPMIDPPVFSTETVALYSA